MKIKDVRSGFSEVLTPFMQEHGFVDRNQDCNFSRKSGEFILIFNVQVYGMAGWFFTKPSVRVGCPVLN